MLETLLIIAGILVPGLLVAYVTNRFVVPVSRTTLWIALLLSFLAVAPGLVPGKIPVPLDEVMRGDPFRGIVGEVHPANPLTNDTVKLFLPWYSAAKAQMFAGDLPLWNPWSFSGYPLLANGEAAPLSPFFLLTIFVPLPGQIVAMAGLKVFVAFLFGMLFLGRLGASRWAAAFGSAAFALSIYQFVYLYYSAATISALLPAVAFGLLLIFDDPGWRSTSFFAITVSVAMASGHPESVLHIGIGGLIVIAAVLVRGTLPDIRRSASMIIAGSLLGLAFAALAWIPVAEQVTQSQRLAEVSTHRQMNEPFSGLAAWALASPDAFGNPARGTWAWKYNYPVVASSYAGAIVLSLLPLAILWPGAGALSRTFGTGAILTWLLAMKWTFVGNLADLPPLSLVGNDKLRFVSVFLAASAAALVVDRWQGRTVRVAFGACGAGFVVSWLVIAMQYFPQRMGLVAIVGPAAVVALLIAVWRRPSMAASIAFVASVVELSTLGLPYNATADERFYEPSVPVIAEMKELAPEEPWRFAGLDWTLLPNTSAIYRIEDVRGSDPMAWNPYLDWLGDAAVPTPGADLARILDPGDDRLDVLNVRFLVTGPQQEANDGWALVYEGVEARLYENRQWRRRFFEVAEGEAEPAVRSMWIAQSKPGRFRLTVDAARPTLIGSSEPALSGWSVSVEGDPVPLEDVPGPFVGFRIPEGTSKIVVDYRPVSVVAGLWISVISLGGWLAMSLRPGAGGRRAVDATGLPGS